MSNRMPIDEEVAALGDLSREELAERWTKTYGHPPPKGARRDFLLRAAAWHLQANRLGGLSPDTRRLLRAATAQVKKQVRRRRDPATGGAEPDASASPVTAPRKQLSPGTRLVRDWNGRSSCRRCAGGGVCVRGQAAQVADGNRPSDHRRPLVRPEVLRAMSAHQKKLRCAVYTRKSTEEGLDQEFNSLDAQREACVAFIASQAGLGWRLVADHYDDGGISGGTMERPALKRLLQDIRDRKVDVVVVYKIDRLTRSLMDFSKIVEVFDANDVSFVSVTQQFNTTTSMGRLTLNVLLSFAQFEREVTAERIRDKIAASRKKGIWMGGTVPLGYRAVDRKLVIDAEAADKVRESSVAISN